MSEVILLSDSNIWGEVGNMRYMGPYALASSLRKHDINTTVIDYFTRHPDLFNYLNQFLSPDTLAVGISSTFLAPKGFAEKERKQRSEGPINFYSGELWFNSGSELIGWLTQLKAVIKSKAPMAELLLGGAKSQSALSRPQIYQLFDSVVIGPADKTILNYVQTRRRGETPAFKMVNGIRLLDNAIDIKEKECPEAILLSSDAIQQAEALPIELSRGCVFNCKFCHYDKKESFKKPYDILKRELIRNYETFGTQFYSFCDDCFNDHPKKVDEVCNLFLSLPFKIEWSAYARVDVAVKYPHTADLMVASGARGLYWGLESFNHIVARNAGKGTPTEKVQEFLIEFNKKNSGQCIMEGSFVTGLPGETDQSLEELEDWLMKNPVLDSISIGSLNLMPYIPSLDKVSIDYAEYSRNPKKYGFDKIQFNPYYWSHTTMDMPQAIKWAERIGANYKKIRPKGLFDSIWAYPHLRGLGFTKQEAYDLICDGATDNLENKELIKQRFRDHLQKYWQKLSLSATVEEKQKVSA